MAQDRGMPMEVVPTRTAFVYDTRSGKVVHVHQFVPAHPGGSIAEDEMEKAALAFAPAAHDRDHLRVLHADAKQVLSPDHDYRVDLKSRALVVDRTERLLPGDRPKRAKRSR